MQSTFETAFAAVQQTVKISLRHPADFKGTHVYETIHGQFHFKRVIPE
jgi:hypothetical protein